VSERVELHRVIRVHEGEDPQVVAEDLIGPQGQAELLSVTPQDHGRYAVVYLGTAKQLVSVRANASRRT